MKQVPLVRIDYELGKYAYVNLQARSVIEVVRDSATGWEWEVRLHEPGPDVVMHRVTKPETVEAIIAWCAQHNIETGGAK